MTFSTSTPLLPSYPTTHTQTYTYTVLDAFRVFPILISKSKRPKEQVFGIHAAVLMAAPPLKSQPLHNFSLPHLKWAHKNSSSSVSGSTSHQHRFRRRDSPDQHHHGADGHPETGPTNPKKQRSTASPRNHVVFAKEEENGEWKPWNLRSRKEVIKAASNSNKETAAEKQNISNSNGLKSQRLRGLVEGGEPRGGVERKEKRKVWISLSRGEIEEDVYALTGGKPPRRPRKWPKNVQKQLDNVFPGLYLVGLAPESYRVHDAMSGI